MSDVDDSVPVGNAGEPESPRLTRNAGYYNDESSVRQQQQPDAEEVAALNRQVAARCVVFNPPPEVAEFCI